MTKPFRILSCGWTAAVSWLLLTCWAGPSLADETVAWRLLVNAPEDTERLFLAGSLASVGRWDPAGVELARQPDGRWLAEMELPPGTEMEFKFTRGTWTTVEGGQSGRDIANRTLDTATGGELELTIVGWKLASPDEIPTTRTGTVREHSAFVSQYLAHARRVQVWLPPGYETSDARYAVLYLHDGQNVFDRATSFAGREWQADETAGRLIAAGRIEPLILVAIDNTSDRLSEYTSWTDPKHGGGAAANYERFLIEELKPFIDTTYRTLADRDHTGVAGSSLGGLVSLDLALRHPETFGRCAALSPALGWADGAMLKYAAEALPPPGTLRLWVDMGSAETADVDGRNGPLEGARELVNVLDAAGYCPGRDYYFAEVHQGRHDEAAWADRFDQVLLFLFAPPHAVRDMQESSK